MATLKKLFPFSFGCQGYITAFDEDCDSCHCKRNYRLACQFIPFHFHHRHYFSYCFLYCLTLLPHWNRHCNSRLYQSISVILAIVS